MPDTSHGRRDPDRNDLASSVSGTYPGSEYTPAEWELANAVYHWQKKHRVRYPSSVDVFRVMVRELHYRKMGP